MYCCGVMGKLNRVAATLTLLAAAAWGGSVGATVIVDFGNINTSLGDKGVGEVKIFLDAVASASTSTGHVGSQTGLPNTPVITFDTSGVVWTSNLQTALPALMRSR